MLTGKQKSYLRGLAQTRRPLFQIGKEGISENLIMTLEDSLVAHELVKLNTLKTCPIEVREAAIELAAATHSEIVGIVGRTFILYRKSKKNICQL